MTRKILGGSFTSVNSALLEAEFSIVLRLLMSIFAVLSFPLAASLAISLRGAEIIVPSRRGLLVGTAWFILWGVLRIVLSDFLVPEPMPLEIYGNYTVFLLG